MGTQSRASRCNDPRRRAREGADALAGARRPPSGNIGSAPRRSSAVSRGASAPVSRASAARGGFTASDIPDSVADAEATAARRERAAAAASRARHRRRVRIAVASVVAVLLLVAAVGVGGFAWLRWFSGDDASDIQGTWYLAGTSTPIEITEDRINLTDDVSYRYALNPTDKTIAFTFTNLAGSGCYRFSLDRQELALVDGTFTGFDTLGRDIGWIAEALVKKLQGERLSPGEAGTEGLTLLSRKPTSGATAAKSDAAAEKAGAAKKSDTAAKAGATAAKSDAAKKSDTTAKSDDTAAKSDDTAAKSSDTAAKSNDTAAKSGDAAAKSGATAGR